LPIGTVGVGPLKGMVRPENFYPPLERAQKNMQEHVFGSFLSILELGPI